MRATHLWPLRRLRPLVTALTAAVLAGVLSAGCATMPDHGPLVEAKVPSAPQDEQASDIDPLPPRGEESPTELVQGFLDAMQASPIRTDVAREYLTDSAGAQWDPEASTTTYAYSLPPRTVGASNVVVRLEDPERLDRTGAWQGRVEGDAAIVHLHVVVEHGEYRIADPPDSLIVPASWFSQRFRQASLYFFDPTARILVPQPVFVQRGDQFASALISGLLSGPGEDLSGVVRTFLPPGLRIGLSVPVSSRGVADIDLRGGPGLLSGRSVQRALAQLAWTLRQEPDITALTLRLEGTTVPLPGGADTYPVDEADRFDPTGYHASARHYGLRAGLLVSSYTSDFEPLSGPLSTARHDLRSVSVAISGDRAAGVSSDGTAVVMAPVSTTGVAKNATVRTVVAGGTDFLRPAWDFSGRLWLVDRRDGHAQVSYVAADRRRTVHVPGVSGRDVTRVLVSRDGTRLVAVVSGTVTDQVRAARLVVDPDGRHVRARPSTALAGSPADRTRIVDAAWTSATTVAVLTPLVPRTLMEVRTVRVDGSPTGSDDLTTTVSAPVIGLAGSPVPGVTTYAVSPGSLLELATGSSAPILGDRVTSIGYVG